MRKENFLKSNKFILFLLSLSILALFCYYMFDSMTAESFDYNFERRIKIIASIVVVSIAISFSSIIFQTITTNYILTPSIMGLDSLYIFLQTIVIFFFGSASLAMMNSISEFFISIFFMVISSVGLFLLMFKSLSKSVYFVVLIGMVSGIAFDGLSNFMQVIIDPNEFAILEGKMFASFNRINTDLLFASSIILAICSTIFAFDFKNLDVLSLGRANAITLGINYKFLVFKSLVIVSILTAVSTALVGPITFLGILVVSIARSLFGTYKHSILVPSATLVSLFVLIFGMIITERFLNFSVPLSVIINFVGGICFIYLMLKMKKI